LSLRRKSWQAVAACELDPFVVREGKERLFEKRLFKTASEFYRGTRGKGAKAQDPSTFFKRRNMGREFRRFRNGSRNSHRGRYQKAFRSFKSKRPTNTVPPVGDKWLQF
jgi:hypothetical protein